MSEEGRKRTTVQDGVGLILSGVGGLFSVSIFLYLLDWRPKEMIWNEPVKALIDLLGGVPGLIFCLALAVLGTLMFLGAKSLEVGKHSLGIVGATLGLSLAFGTLGGSIGGLIPGMISGKAGLFLSLTLGLTVLLTSVWVTWFGGVSIPWKPRGSSSVIAPTVKEPEGVSAAEAAALASDPNGVRGLPTMQPTSPDADVRRHGGVPEGAQPLGTDERYAQDPFAYPAESGEDTTVRGEGADGPVPLVADEPVGSDLVGGDDAVVEDAGEAAAEELSSSAFAAEVKPVQEEGAEADAELPLASWEAADYEGEDDEVYEPEPIEAVAESSEELPLEASEETDEPEEEYEEEELVAEADEEEDGDEEYEDEEYDEAEELLAEGEEEPEEEADEEYEEAEELVAEADDDEGEEEEDGEEYEYEEEELVAEDEAEDEEEPEEEYEEEEELVAEADEDDEEEEELVAEADEEEVDEEVELAAEVDEEPVEEEAEVDVAPAASDDDGPVQPGLFDVDEPVVHEPAAEKPEEDFVLQPQEAPEPEPEPAVAQESPADREKLVYAAGLLILEHNRVAVSMLERQFQLDFDQACEILDELQNRGLIGPYKGGRTREILLSEDEWLALAP